MEWIRTFDRLPTEADVDKFGKILVYSPLYGIESAIPEDILDNEQHFTYWAKTILPKPTDDQLQ